MFGYQNLIASPFCSNVIPSIGLAMWRRLTASIQLEIYHEIYSSSA